ncbi:MAG: hypothetical protein DME23_15920 [Verrucomicrobia bacterium]|nr:MAG: hypothetical protein DME23_15920 [Verrucomicrobiota bacterium]
MPWIIQNLWLIPALLILAAALSALAHAAGAERREKVAHGVSRGFRGSNTSSPGGASENKSHSVTILCGLRVRLILSPLTGLVAFGNAVPRLTPWASIYRRYAAASWQRFSARE